MMNKADYKKFCADLLAVWDAAEKVHHANGLVSAKGVGYGRMPEAAE